MAPLIALSLVTVAAVSTTSVLARPAVHWSLQHNSNKVAQLDNAHAGPRLSILAPSTVSKTSPFASLTADDAKSVVDYLHSLPELNLTAYDQAEDWDNRITGIDLVFPAKSPAIEYLDGSGSVPPRFAKVDVRFQATAEPYAEQWLVGPLPIGAETKAEPYTSVSTKNSSRIRIYSADYAQMNDFARARAEEANEVIKDLLGAGHNDFDLWGPDAMPNEDGRVELWLGFWGRPSGYDAQTILPQGLYMHLDVTGRNSAAYSLLGWLYNGNYYKSLDEFKAAWSSPGFIKPERNSVTGSEQWVGTDRKGAEIPLDNLPPPISVQAGDKRFTIDDNGLVRWGDFSFYIAYTRDTGVRLFDIRFRGQRIVYELGLDEAIAHYSGSDPVQAGTAYLDSFYHFGEQATAQVLGFDVPTYATCLDAITHGNEASTTHANAICLFEADTNYAIQRHSTGDYASATKNIALTLRFISTIGNYDYTFDTMFYRDGTIEIVVKASGYIQSAFHASNQDFGYKIRDGLSGSMHTHVLTFALDLDILGVANTLLNHRLVADRVDFPWSSKSRNTMRLVRDTIKNENEGKLDWAPNGESMYIVANVDTPNKYGELPGYWIKPSRGGVGQHLTPQISDVLFNSQGFATHGLFVAQRKDTEPGAASSLNAFDQRDPIVNFDARFNGESLEQVDLMLHVNLGMHHVPVSEDLPNTVMSVAQSGFMLVPHNYFTENPSSASNQMVRINLDDEGKATDINYFGGQQPNGTVNVAGADLSQYHGDTVMRSFGFEGDGAVTQDS